MHHLDGFPSHHWFYPMRQLYNTSDISPSRIELATVSLENDAVRPRSLNGDEYLFHGAKHLHSRLKCLFRAAFGNFHRLRMYSLLYLCASQPRHDSSTFAASRSTRPLATIARPRPRPETSSIDSKRLFKLHFRLRYVTVQKTRGLKETRFPSPISTQCFEYRSSNNRGSISWVTTLRQQVPSLVLNKGQGLFTGRQVTCSKEGDDIRNPTLVSKHEFLSRHRRSTLCSIRDEYGTIHLCINQALHPIGLTCEIVVTVTSGSVVFYVRSVDSETTRKLPRCNLILCRINRIGSYVLTGTVMIARIDCANDHRGPGSLKLFFGLLLSTRLGQKTLFFFEQAIMWSRSKKWETLWTFTKYMPCSQLGGDLRWHCEIRFFCSHEPNLLEPLPLICTWYNAKCTSV